jgi:hypothetical protein
MVQKITTIVEVLDKASKPLKRIVQEHTRTLDKNNQVMKQQTKTVTGLTERFKMHYLSVLFFGMAIQRIFQGIMRSATQTYLKITEGTTEASQAIIGLQSGIQLLQFAIGEALGSTLIPLLPMLMGIIEGVLDFISQNKELVSWLLIAGLAFGSFLMWTGIIKLGIQGVITWLAGAKGLISIFGILKTTIMTIVIPALSSLYTFLLANPILLIIAALVALYVAWETNFLGIKDITYDVFKTMIPILIQIGQGVSNLVSLILTAAEAVGNFLGWDTRGLNDAIVNMTVMWQNLEDLKNEMANIDKETYMNITPLQDILGATGRLNVGGGNTNNSVTIENIDMRGVGQTSATTEYEMSDQVTRLWEKNDELLQKYGGGYQGG